MELTAHKIKNMALMARGPLPVTVFNDIVQEEIHMPEIVTEYEARLWSSPENDNLLVRIAFSGDNNETNIFCIWSPEEGYQNLLNAVLDFELFEDDNSNLNTPVSMMSDLLWNFIGLVESGNPPIKEMLLWDEMESELE
jgi:hypothetical protein